MKRARHLTLVVVNDRPPVAKCQPIIRSADPTCSATVAASEIDAGSFDPDGDALSFALAPPGPYPLGATSVVLTVSDGRGASATCASTVNVIDTTPPVITGAAADPAVLWPPNHRMVDVTLDYAVSDNCTPAGALACGLAATSSEAADGRGDGHTAVDIAVIDAGHVLLRAERSGRGPGRIYTVAITCTDEATNATSVAVSVDVLHSRP